MSEPKLQITSKRYTGESTVVSLRLPKDMLRDVDDVARMTGRTRNELMQLCLEFSLNHIEIATNHQCKIVKIEERNTGDGNI
jgi:predicted DNA-binding protein